MTNSTSLEPDVPEIVAAVKRREEQGRLIQIDEHHVQLVVCLLDQHYYAFFGDAIQEIIPAPTITYVPGMPTWVLGVIHARGKIESVLDVCQILGLPAAVITEQSRIAIGEWGELRSGLLVDSVEDVLEIPQDAIHQPASDLETAGAVFVVGETLYDGHPLIILDIGKIFEGLFVDTLRT